MQTPTGAASSGRFNFVEFLAKELNRGKPEVPGFPDIVMRVRRALDDPNATVNSITQIVSAEPVLTARILRISNSAALRPATGQIKDPRNAIARMGFTLVQSATVAFAAEQMRIANRYEAAKERFAAVWDRSIHVAAIAYVLAKHCTKLNPDEALLTGLMHSIGKIYIVARAEDHPELFEDDSELEAVLSDWYVATGEAILQGWEFPEEIVMAVASQLDLERDIGEQAELADVLMVALPIPSALGEEAALNASLAATQAELRLGLTPEKCATLLGEAQVQIRELRSALGN
jgi:HD-like signal output (HDOD) protein